QRHALLAGRRIEQAMVLEPHREHRPDSPRFPATIANATEHTASNDCERHGRRGPTTTTSPAAAGCKDGAGGDARHQVTSPRNGLDRRECAGVCRGSHAGVYGLHTAAAERVAERGIEGLEMQSRDE